MVEILINSLYLHTHSKTFMSAFFKINFFPLSLFFVLHTPLYAQDIQLIDSLSNALTNAKADTIRITLINDISWQYKYSDLKKSFDLAEKALQWSEKINYEKGISPSESTDAFDVW